MCGGDNVYGIIAGLVAGAAMLVLAFADKPGGEATAPAHRAVAQVVQIVSPIGVEFQHAGGNPDLNWAPLEGGQA